ncbi:hypothetical protein EC950943_4119A, partial [Escherichia coli 95.0943]
MFNSLSLNV